MPVLNDVLAGSLAQAVQVQQIIDAMKGTPSKGVPVSFTALSDTTNYALTVQNDDATNSRALLVLKSDGTTLIAADATGVTLGSPVNLPSGSINGGTALANGSVTNAKLGPDVARANLLTNGGMEVWQRGNGAFTATNTYAADRWLITLGGTDTLSVSRDTTNMDAGSLACAACTFVHGSGTQTLLNQMLKSADGYQLRSATVSLSVRVRANTATAVRAFIAGDGTGFSTAFSAYHSGGGTYETLTCTVTVPTDNTFVQPGVQFTSANTTAYVDNASLVVGSQPANYVPLHPADDLARCQRYYELLGGAVAQSPVFSGYNAASGGQNAFSYIPYHVVKATIPTVTKAGTWSTTNCGQPSVSSIDVLGATYLISATAAGYFNAYGGSGIYYAIEANP